MRKKFFISTFELLLICLSGFAQTTIIERPQFATANTDAFEISKLELKNSETVLYCDGYGKPNDIISLSSKSYLKGESGKVYKFIRSEGFEMDKEITVTITNIKLQKTRCLKLTPYWRKQVSLPVKINTNLNHILI